MAQPPTTSGSEVSKVEDDISQTVSLAGSIVTLVREPVVLLYGSYTKAQELKRNLGPWHREAIDSHGQCRIPVLRLKEFEDYLIRTDGWLCPQEISSDSLSPSTQSPGQKENNRTSWGLPWPLPKTSPKPETTPAAKACWAYLLLALGIRPGMDIVGWRPSSDGYISTQNGGIEMEVDGSVLCHLMNLYGLSHISNSWVRRPPTQIPRYTDNKVCKFAFGTLSWEKTDGQIHAHFEPGVEKELYGAKVPFAALSISFEPNTLVATYLTVLEHGVCDPELHLADPRASLKERVQTLIKCLHRVEFGQKPSIISYRWFEEAARVKRRVLAQGGSDHSVFEDICVMVEQSISVVGDRAFITRHVRRGFLLDGETFTFCTPATGLGRPSVNSTEERASFLVRKTLESYSQHPSGTWKHDLYTMREDVMKIFRIKSIILGRNTWLLQFTDDSPLWHERVLLGTPAIC